jgi:hypothetical protein
VTKTKALVWVIGFSFVILLLDIMRQSISPTTPTRTTPLIGTVMAADGACPIPPLERLAGDWHVTSVGCTTAACKATHFSVGDKLTFQQDVSGARNFSIAAEPSKPGARRAHSEGYELRSDGIGNATGPIVLDHDPLDGTPMQLHWMIVKLRAHDADGFGLCKLHALAVVCEQEPAKGSSQCTDQQHAGNIHLDP